MTAPICAITGAGGAIGPVVAEEFGAAGFRVLALTHRDVNVEDYDGLRRAISGVDVVVHLAARLHIGDPLASMHDDYRRINVGGTENLIRAARTEGVGRIVHASTIAVYGYNKGIMLTEESDTAPDTVYGRTKLASERVALDGGAAVLRFAAVYGARMKGNYRRLARSINRGRFISIGAGQNRRTVVYDRDVARAVLIASQHPAAPRQVFNVTDGTVHTVTEIVEAIASASNRRLLKVSLPVGLVRAGAVLLETGARALGAEAPVTKSMIDTYMEDVTVSDRKIRQVLGFVPEYGLLRGWSESIQMMRDAGDL